ncbi:AAA family ATPase [Streptomyces sp. NPDC090025]|uniref:AAA family ATPase n=1 Tax=Streptomyces sp. NPDC090025 TaxID=3365922 RepID=UPI0038378757
MTIQRTIQHTDVRAAVRSAVRTTVGTTVGTTVRTASTAVAGTGLPVQRTRARARFRRRVRLLRDLRERGGRSPRVLTYAAGDVVVVSGLPGAGKSTLMGRAAQGRAIDSQDTRERWEARLPRFLPYAVYRPLARLAHYAGLRRALRAGAGVIVHDCGTQSWVRGWLAREARRRGAALHLILLDVDPGTARDGQLARGRGVSAYAFARHRRAVGRLVRTAEEGALPPGCASVTLLDRDAADTLRKIGFRDAS